jgi:hypothetical protein
MTGANETSTERALSLARLPDRLDGWRVLEVGSSEAGQDYLVGLGARDFVALAEPSEEAGLEEGTFDLVVCGSELETDLHPLAVYAWLRRAVRQEGLLVAGSDVLSDPARSQYARWIPPQQSDGRSRWLPGRLAFRWLVEVSGFDVLSWLGDAGEDTANDGRAYLQAEAAARPPALDLDRQPLGR